MKARQGMTLIETAVAVALLAVIVISILSAFSATTIATNRHANLSKLDLLTRSDAEYIKSQAYSTAGAYSNLSGGGGFSVSNQVLYYNPQSQAFNGVTDSGLQEIILTVKGPNALSEQLDFLKVQP